jgi:uncharacterized protein (DUF58 family)
MSPMIGWGLAALAIAVGYVQWGWQGALFGMTLAVFWLLLQFNRVMRVMRRASESPKGEVSSAVMLNARLRPGLRLIEILALTRSLGERVDGDAGAAGVERWRWRDAGGDEVLVTLGHGRCTEWRLVRAAAPPEGENAPL